VDVVAIDMSVLVVSLDDGLQSVCEVVGGVGM